MGPKIETSMDSPGPFTGGGGITADRTRLCSAMTITDDALLFVATTRICEAATTITWLSFDDFSDPTAQKFTPSPLASMSMVPETLVAMTVFVAARSDVTTVGPAPPA